MQMRLTEDGTPYGPRRYPSRLDGRRRSPQPPRPHPVKETLATPPVAGVILLCGD
jgi:hypothetical protein